MAIVRAEERKRSAALRAMSGVATAELRGLRLSTGAHTHPVQSPYLTLA